MALPACFSWHRRSGRQHPVSGSAKAGDSWRLINYSGSLTNKGLGLCAVHARSTRYHSVLDTATSGQARLVVTGPHSSRLAAVPEPSTTALLALLAAADTQHRRGRP